MNEINPKIKRIASLLGTLEHLEDCIRTSPSTTIKSIYEAHHREVRQQLYTTYHIKYWRTEAEKKYG